MEVGEDWKATIVQVATHARRSISESSMRTFVLVLGCNCETSTLRFLIFHRGGLTASEECNIAEHDGLEETMRLFLTLASWGTAEEAGVITSRC